MQEVGDEPEVTKDNNEDVGVTPTDESNHGETEEENMDGVEITEDEAAVESSLDVGVELSLTESAVEMSQTIPADEMSQTEPAVEMSQTEAVVEGSHSELAIDIPQTESAADVSQAEPVVEMSHAKPADEMSQIEAVVEMSQTEPANEVSQTEPVAEVSQIEPVVEISQTEPADERGSEVQQDEIGISKEEETGIEISLDEVGHETSQFETAIETSNEVMQNKDEAGIEASQGETSSRNEEFSETATSKDNVQVENTEKSALNAELDDEEGELIVDDVDETGIPIVSKDTYEISKASMENEELQNDNEGMALNEQTEQPAPDVYNQMDQLKADKNVVPPGFLANQPENLIPSGVLTDQTEDYQETETAEHEGITESEVNVDRDLGELEVDKVHGKEDQKVVDHEVNGLENEHVDLNSIEVDKSHGTEATESTLEGLNGEAAEECEYDDDDDLEGEFVSFDNKSLPQCRLKRNYACLWCGLNTLNPREHLYHLRDKHGERMKIFECPECIYASKNNQKLIRHARMVHKIKIKSNEGSSSPSKKRSKSPRSKVSPSKSSRGSVSPGKSSRSSPGKSPRSTEGDGWEDDDEEEMEEDGSPVKESDEKGNYNCGQCEFTCRSRKLLNKHETTLHLKRRFFRCVKCNYVTHLKGRYTKHMKYHQLPILKCEYCDFRTPYRWNLDRHMKNHTEDSGEYKCHLCNFTAQIKQSLTVHISNHHLTPEQIREREMKRTIGISDPADCTSDDQEMEMMRLERDEHPDALRLPGLEYPDSPLGQDSHHNGNSFRVSNIDVGGTEDSLANAGDGRDEDGEPKPKKPKIKITLKKMKEPKQRDTFFQELNERHNFQEDFIHPDDVVHRHGNVYIKTFKCDYCSFKAAFRNEVNRHEKKIHGIGSKSDVHSSKKSKKLSKSSKTSKERSDTQVAQHPLAMNVEPHETRSRRLSTDRMNTSDSKDVEMKDVNVSKKDNIADLSMGTSSKRSTEDSNDSQTPSSKEASPVKEVGKKKNSSSFFDKLQEKISTSNVQNLVCQFCGHESKCLSQSLRHQKLHLSAKNIYASASLSTRCQFCRHRCKTTDDLVNHLKLCPEARKNQIMDSGKRVSGGRQDGDDEANDDNIAEETTADKESTNDDKTSQNLDSQQHPMENRVFVWNEIRNQEEAEGKRARPPTNEDEKKANLDTDVKDKEKSRVMESPSKETSKSPIMMDHPLDYIESPIPLGPHRFSKRVYRCPQCSFWAVTASRFHVHIVGHFNKKPYSCSECTYKSNWRWDITKHIKLKTSRDNSHQNAEVVITDSTGEKNYEKYDRYQTIIQCDEMSAHRSEGGIPNKKGRPKRTPEKEEAPEAVTPSVSPVRKHTSPVRRDTSPVSMNTSPVLKDTSPVHKQTSPVRNNPSLSQKPTSPTHKPPMVSIPMIPVPRLPGLPRLTRAPPITSTPSSIPSTSHPGPMPFGPILPGPQAMVQIASSTAAALKTSIAARLPPPLSLRAAGILKGTQSIIPTPPITTHAALGNAVAKTGATEEVKNAPPLAGAQYQIITPQGAVNTSLETLQLLASGSTNLTRLKKLQKGVVRSEEKEPPNPNSHQVSVSSTGEDGREVAKMVLDHEGNPEWKCNTCDFRDSERETVFQHVRLAHARGGPVSLLHAVHRCDVCGYAAGTKRAVQLHIDSSHGGQGGITSRCEGQTPDPKESGDGETPAPQDNTKMIRCRVPGCPYTCKKRNEMRAHSVYHMARPNCIFKCMFCPYYVPTKLELFEHLSIHGMDVPAAVLESLGKTSNNNTHNNNINSSNSSSSSVSPSQIDDGSRQFLCGACPFETRSRSKLMHHRQFHKPKGLPFKCPHCTYNVTRRHLLAQHIRVHGIDPGPNDGLDVNESTVDDRSNSPSPSLTITPVNNVASVVGERGQHSTFTDASSLPKLTDQMTMLLADIPLVWVSRDSRFFKMFKCRHCPHVNLRKTNIQEHEKMHKTGISKESGGLHCPNCSYISVNAGVMSSHLKVHGGSMGHCHAIVDPSLTDEDQLRILTSKASSSPDPSVLSNAPIKEEIQTEKTDEKLIYFCQQCPARFFFEKEIQIHSRFHTANLPNHCKSCNFGARQEAHLLTHVKVHTLEYQERTRAMIAQHRAAISHPPVPGLSLPLEALMNMTSITQQQQNKEDSRKRPYMASPTPPVSGGSMQPPSTSKFVCDQCPASFSKPLTLQYHQSLHGANNPHKCPRCSYAGKTADNLKQHQQLHDQCDENIKEENAAKEVAAKEMMAKVEAANAAAAAVVAAAAKEAEAAANPKTLPPPFAKAEKYRVENPSKYSKHSKPEKDSSGNYPPIKLKLIGLRPVSSENGSDGSRPQFKYYVEEQVPLSGVDLLRRKTEIEKEGHWKSISEVSAKSSGKSKSSKDKEDSTVETNPMRIGDRNLHYPLHIDKITGKAREKRYKCDKCPSAFEKTEQYHVHNNLHGSNHKYKCQICDYSVKFYANFMMHINRHKYHEKMVAQQAGTALPPEEDPKYLPAVDKPEKPDTSTENKSTKNNKNEDKENLDAHDLTTSERQHLLLQTKKGVDTSKKEPEKEKQVYYCMHCPYANVRRDAVDSHSYRHLINGGNGVYRCTLCDYTASQLNFIKEHTKVHFRPFKYVNAEGFMRIDRHEILSTPLFPQGTKPNDETQEKEEGRSLSRKKQIVFSHDAGVYLPGLDYNEDGNSELVGSIKVDFLSGDVVDAPDDFVIALRPTKTKSGLKYVELSEPVVGDAPVSSKSSEFNTETSLNEDNVSVPVSEVISKEPVETEVHHGPDGSSAMDTESPAMETETPSHCGDAMLPNGYLSSEQIPAPTNDDLETQTGVGHFTQENHETVSHVALENIDIVSHVQENQDMVSHVSHENNEAMSTVDQEIKAPVCDDEAKVSDEEEDMEIDVETVDDLPELPLVPKPWGPEQSEPLVSSH